MIHLSQAADPTGNARTRATRSADDGSDEMRDPKIMAKALRAALGERGTALTHSEALELVARMLGHRDWNTAAAALAPETLPALVLPDGWKVTGTQAEDYVIGIDPERPGGPARIRSLMDRANGEGFATLMQSIEAGDLRGGRIRLRAEIRVVEVDGFGAIWMRVDGTRGRRLRFDNLQRRGETLSGTTGWTAREIVLDVAEEAESVHYGFLLRGIGEVAARGFVLERVDASVSVTSDRGVWEPAPENLGMAARAADRAC